MHSGFTDERAGVCLIGPTTELTVAFFFGGGGGGEVPSRV